MHIPIVSGRGFESGDIAGPGVVVINEAMAKRFYKDVNPVGRRVRQCCGDSVSGRPNTWMNIVGVAKDVKQGGLDQPAGTELYFSAEQVPRVLGFAYSQYNVVLRTKQSLGAIGPSITSIVRQMDPALPIIQMRTMDQVFGGTVTRQRFLSTLLAIFGAVALILAAIGTYCVVASAVT